MTLLVRATSHYALRTTKFEFASLASKRWSRVGRRRVVVVKWRTTLSVVAGRRHCYCLSMIKWVKYFNAEFQPKICIFMLFLRYLFIELSFKSFKVFFPV